jgi:hypothetical protein
MKRRRTGFSIVEAILVLIIIGLIGLVGRTVVINQNILRSAAAPEPAVPAQPSIRVVRWSGLPVDLRLALQKARSVMYCDSHARTLLDPSSSTDTYNNYSYMENAFVMVDFGCEPPSTHIFAKTNGKWVDSAQTYDLYFKCSDLKSAKVPRSFSLQLVKNTGFKYPTSRCYGDDGVTKVRY